MKNIPSYATYDTQKYEVTETSALYPHEDLLLIIAKEYLLALDTANVRDKNGKREMPLKWVGHSKLASPLQGLMVADGVAYCVTEKKLLSFDVGNGKPVWKKPVCANATLLPPVQYGDSLFLVDKNGQAYKLRKLTGKKQWNKTFHPGKVKIPPVTDGSSFFYIADDQIISLDLDSGDVNWQQPIPDLDTWAISSFFATPHGLYFTAQRQGDVSGLGEQPISELHWMNSAGRHHGGGKHAVAQVLGYTGTWHAWSLSPGSKRFFLNRSYMPYIYPEAPVSFGFNYMFTEQPPGKVAKQPKLSPKYLQCDYDENWKIGGDLYIVPFDMPDGQSGAQADPSPKNSFLATVLNAADGGQLKSYIAKIGYTELTFGEDVTQEPEVRGQKLIDTYEIPLSITAPMAVDNKQNVYVVGRDKDHTAIIAQFKDFE